MSINSGHISQSLRVYLAFLEINDVGGQRTILSHVGLLHLKV